MADKINIKRFTRGRSGSLTFDQLNSIVELLERTAEKAQRNENALQLAESALPQSAHPTNKTDIIAKIDGSPLLYGTGDDKVAAYDWEEVQWDAIAGKFVSTHIYPQRGSKLENPAIDLSFRQDGADGEIVHLTRIRQSDESARTSGVTQGWGFAPNPLIANAATCEITDNAGAIGAKYKVEIISTGVEVEATNLIETSKGGLLGTEIDTENCENSPTWEAKRLEVGLQFVVHSSKNSAGDDEYSFALPCGLEIDCGCPEEESLVDGPLLKIDAASFMLGSI